MKRFTLIKGYDLLTEHPEGAIVYYSDAKAKIDAIEKALKDIIKGECKCDCSWYCTCHLPIVQKALDQLKSYL